MSEPTETYIITLPRRWLAKIEGYITLSEQAPYKPMRIKFFSFDVEKPSDFVFDLMETGFHPFMPVLEFVMNVLLKSLVL